MLVLTRKKDETIVIDGPAVITILKAVGGTARIGVSADRDVTILRGELIASTDDGTDEADGNSQQDAA